MLYLLQFLLNNICHFSRYTHKHFLFKTQLMLHWGSSHKLPVLSGTLPTLILYSKITMNYFLQVRKYRNSSQETGACFPSSRAPREVNKMGNPAGKQILHPTYNYNTGLICCGNKESKNRLFCCTHSETPRNWQVRWR